MVELKGNLSFLFFLYILLEAFLKISMTTPWFILKFYVWKSFFDSSA